MYCRLVGMNEHEIGIRQHIKPNVIVMEIVFKYAYSKNSKHEKLSRKLLNIILLYQNKIYLFNKF